MSGGNERLGAPQKSLMKHWKFKPQPRVPAATNEHAQPIPVEHAPTIPPPRPDAGRDKLHHFVTHWKYDSKMGPIGGPTAPARPIPTSGSAPIHKQHSAPIAIASAAPKLNMQFHQYAGPAAAKPGFRTRPHNAHKMRSTSPVPIGSNRSVSPYGRPYPHSVGHTPPQPSFLGTTPPSADPITAHHPFQLLLSSVERQLRLEEVTEEQLKRPGLLDLVGAAEMLEQAETAQHHAQYTTDSDTESEDQK